MISSALPLAAGNAVRLWLSPPAGAACWRILRRTDGSFAGPADPNAEVIAACSSETVVLDVLDLVNGTQYFYRDYTSPDGGQTWQDSGVTATATPAATYQDSETAVQQLVRDRLAAGLAVEISRGALTPRSGTIDVLMAPFAMADGTTFPVVSVHMDTESSADRVIGEEMTSDFDAAFGVGDTAGWFSRVRLNIAAVSLNGDERIALRLAIRRIVQANLEVFADLGLMNMSLTLSDSENQIESNAPLYMTGGPFECVVPAGVILPSSAPALSTISVSPTTP